MVSVANHLYRRGKTFYLVIKIPTDIRSSFGNKSQIVKALKTSVLSEAKAAIEPLRTKVKLTFLLIRSGLLTEEQLEKAVSELTYKKQFQRRQPEKTLSGIVQMYLDEKSPNIKKRTLLEYEVIFSRIVNMMGDKRLSSYTRDDAVRLRSTLLAEGLKERSCNKHLVHLSSILKWAVRLTLCQINFAEGLLLTISGRHDLERNRFDADDLQKLFSTIPLTYAEEYNAWIPLIALYTGMRREEICQLQRTDIRQVDGIWVFDINNGPEKSTKTEAGLRLVPVHSKLLEMGFLKFCAERATGRKSGNLWGFVRWRESWGKTWGGWFNHWFTTYVQAEKGKCFHSFRHTVTDELKQAGERKELVSELIGHVVSDTTFGRYGKKYSVIVLKNTIEKLAYDFDLSRIRNFIAICEQATDTGQQ